MTRSAPPCPHVYRAINRITAAFAGAGIPKAHFNLIDQYAYRSIDDVLTRLAPLLARHRLCVLPRVLERHAEDRVGEQDSLLIGVQLMVAFDLVSARDGSSHTVQSFGEALDGGDKGTAKAMSAAYKSAMLELFCVPVSSDDADATSHRLKRRPSREIEPVQGWSVWCDGIVDMINVCETIDAIDRVRTRQRGLLEALKRERPELYTRIGEAFAARGSQLTVAKPAKTPRTRPISSSRSARKAETVDA